MRTARTRWRSTTPLHPAATPHGFGIGAHLFVLFIAEQVGKEVLDALAHFDKKLEVMLGGKKYLPGAVVYLESGNSVANAYKFTRIGSRVRCERRSSAWYITDIKCTALYKNGGRDSITLTKEQDERAIEILRTGYTISQLAPAGSGMYK